MYETDLTSPRIGFAREHARKAFKACSHCCPMGFPDSLDSIIPYVIPGYTLISLDRLQKISAITIKQKMLIGFNSSHAQVRVRFSIAHEIGHICLCHPDTVFSSQIAHGVYETEANSFAAEFLVPLSTLKTVFRSIRDPRELAKHFNVSREVIFLRLKESRLLSSIL